MDDTSHMLPPIAWMRSSGWGRDVTRIFRDPDVKFPADYGWEKAMHVKDSMLDAAVWHARMERLIGEITYQSVMDSRHISDEANANFHSGASREYDIAYELGRHAEADHPIASFDEVLTTRFQARPTSGDTVDAFEALNRTVYLMFDGADATDLMGKPLHGILLVRVADEEGGTYHAMTPMAADGPTLGSLAPVGETIGLDTESQMPGESFAACLSRSIDLFEADLVELEDEVADKEKKVSTDVVKLEIEITHKAIAVARAQVEAWSALIMGGLNALADTNRGCVEWQHGAPAGDVAKATSGSTGARKVDQRLRAAGWCKVRRFRHDEPESSSPEIQSIQKGPAKPAILNVASDKPIATKQERPLPRSRLDPRKARRLARQADDSSSAMPSSVPVNQATSTPSAAGDVPVAPTEPMDPVAATTKHPTGGQTDDEIVSQGKPRHEPELIAVVDSASKAAFKDLPPIDGRNWEQSFPPALASMAMRRASVAQAPRENQEATRRRVAADILPRFEGAPELLRRLAAEKSANDDKRLAFAVGKASVLRDVDMEIAEGLAHPVHAVVDDPVLEDAIRFHGVARNPRTSVKRTTLVTAWRENRILHLIGSVQEGSMTGFRRIELDLDDASIETFDSEADQESSDDLLAMLWAPIADCLLGPVDECDAWRWERRRRDDPIKRMDAQPAASTTLVDEEPNIPHLLPETVDEVRGEDPATEGAIHPDMPTRPLSAPTQQSDFSTWESVSARAFLASSDAVAKILKATDTNGVTRTIMRMLESADEEAEESGVRAAAERHVSSLAERDAIQIRTLSSPDFDERDLDGEQDTDGILVITDRALFAHASPGIAGRNEPRPETPLCVLYRLRSDGIAALILQVDGDATLNLARWVRIPLAPSADEDDLSWYLRGAIDLAINPENAKSARVAATEAPVSLPAMRTVPIVPMADPTPAERAEDDAPRRVVAQARIRPASMAAAVGAGLAWFDVTAERQRLRLVSDVRADGEWTIEHRSDDRLNPSVWSTTLRLAQDDPTALDVILRTTMTAGVRPRMPGLIRDIAAATPTSGPDGVLSTSAPIVSTRSDMNVLLRELMSPERILPILLMTQDRNGEWMRDPDEIALQGMGALTVRAVEAHMTFDLTDALGQEYRTFDGAVRLFQPRFDPDTDPASKHPRVMRGAGAERTLADMVTRATSATITRYAIPDVAPQQVTAADAANSPPTVEMTPLSSRTPLGQRRTAVQPAPQTRHVQAFLLDDGRAAGSTPPAPTPTAPIDLAARMRRIRTAATEVAMKPPVPEAPVAPVPIAPTPSENAATPPEPPVAIDQETLERIVQAAVDRRIEEMRAVTPYDSTIHPESGDASAAVEDGQAAPAEVETPSPETPAHRPASGLDTPSLEEAIERRVEATVASRFASLRIGDLIDSVTSMVTRMDAFVTASASRAASTAMLGTVVDDQRILQLEDIIETERLATDALIVDADRDLGVAVAERESALAERDAAEAEVERLRNALNQLRRDGVTSRNGPEWPETLDGLADWLQENPLPNVVVTKKAYNGMKRIRFADMERLCRTLILLDGAYVDQRQGLEGGRQRWLDGLKDLHLDSKKQTEMGKGIRSGNEYRFDHEGRRWGMDFHLRGIEKVHNETDRLLRIYFAYDEERGRVLIGHMPTHLTTIDS